jgi:ferredoxin--NADP+ reductase
MLNATLVSRVDFGDDLCILHVRPDAGVPSFLPGQFIRLGLYQHDPSGEPTDRLVRRAYSLASSPKQREALELYVVKVRDGRFTPQVWELGPGARLWVDSKAQGEFTLSEIPVDRDLLMVATGTGIAPFVSMIRTHAGEGRWRRFTVVHGARRALDLGYREELELAARRYPEIRYVPIISREPESTAWPGMRGRVLQVFDPTTYERLSGGRLDPGDADVFLCGNPDMVTAARALAEALGFVMSTRRRAGTLHLERYW